MAWLKKQDKDNFPGKFAHVRDTYSPQVIRRALKHSACTSYKNFLKICDQLSK